MPIQPAVYMLASGRNGTLYIGVTGNLLQRVWQHRNHIVNGFTSRYDATSLVWFEQHPTMESAILRETRLKRWRRADKIRLIEAANPYWKDLWSVIAV